MLVVVGIFDTASHWGKAFGDVYVNGIPVGGMTADEMRDKLRDEFGQRVSHAQVTIYADDDAQVNDRFDLTDEERRAIAEQISAEEAVLSIGSWSTDALSLKATVDYETAIKKAMAVGREDGGLPTRIGLLFAANNVNMGLNFDKDALESLASDIDRTIGDPRIDTTVVVEDGTARVVEGHDGMLVDRSWLSGKITEAMMYKTSPDSFVAQASLAASRISTDKAQTTADGINRAIRNGATFRFQDNTWNADANALGYWTVVNIIDADGKYDLETKIDESLAIPAVVKGAETKITSDDMTVTFEVQGDDVSVKTQGTGNIPEVAPAIQQLNERLYGANGLAWTGNNDTIDITIEESDRPETLSFDQALSSGVITNIGEYTTEFSNQEGTENRNHNIKLAASILNNGVVAANGGDWNFNERSGDTNEEAGFWAAGSIVDGEYVDSIGGGICQVATTVFNAVYEAGLNFVERHNHSLYIASYPTGRDAAVSYPDLDLIWENDLSSDVLLKLSYTDTSVTASLYSVYTGYSVTTETGAWEEGEKYGTRFETDQSLSSGTYYRKTVGEDGSRITIQRTVTDDKDNVLETAPITSVYSAKDEVYVIGPDVDTSALVRKTSNDS